MPPNVHLQSSAADQDKPIEWIGSSKKDLTAFPLEVKKVMGFALRVAQKGGKHEDAKPMHGDLREVMEIKAGDESGTYRTMYTTKLGDLVYVLHAFQKKSKRGIATPEQDLSLLRSRLKDAKQHHAALQRKSG